MIGTEDLDQVRDITLTTVSLTNTLIDLEERVSRLEQARVERSTQTKNLGTSTESGLDSITAMPNKGSPGTKKTDPESRLAELSSIEIGQLKDIIQTCKTVNDILEMYVNMQGVQLN